jgi:hypothetical protein
VHAALDSADGGRYAEVMRILRSLVILTFAMVAAGTGLAARADDAPVLAVLENRGGLLPKRAKILAQRGVFTSPHADLTRAVWTLREGDTIAQEYSPPTRFIKLVHLSSKTPQLLCNIVVRYKRSEKGWRPAYLLLQQSPAVWDGEKFIPRPGVSTREPVQITNPIEPAGDGYYHGLSFGLASGPVRITAWEVQ